MAVLVILENKGDPKKLLPAADELTRRCGRVEGLLFSAIAEQGQQMMLVNASAPYAAEPFGPATA